MKIKSKKGWGRSYGYKDYPGNLEGITKVAPKGEFEPWNQESFDIQKRKWINQGIQKAIDISKFVKSKSKDNCKLREDCTNYEDCTDCVCDFIIEKLNQEIKHGVQN